MIGGLLTAGSNLLIEGLRHKQGRQDQEERDQRELRQASRLVLAELSEVSQTIRQTAKSKLTWRNDRQLPAFAWREYRAILAAHLPMSAWRWVEAAYDEANGLNWRVIGMNSKFEGGTGPVHFNDNEWLREPFRTLHQAMSELEVALGEDRGAFGYTGYADLDDLEAGIW